MGLITDRYDEFSIPKAIFWAILAAGTAEIVDEHHEDPYLDALNSQLTKICAPTQTNNPADKFYQSCIRASILLEKADIQDRFQYMDFFDLSGSDRAKAFKNTLATDYSTIAQKITAGLNVRTDIESSLKDIVVDGVKPLTYTTINLNFQSITQPVSADNSNTQYYTGTFNVVVTDTGTTNPTSRTFAFDPVTGNVMGTSGTGSTSANLTEKGRYKGNFSGGHYQGAGVSQGTNENMQIIDCKSNPGAACATIEFIHAALNDLPNDALKSITYIANENEFTAAHQKIRMDLDL